MRNTDDNRIERLYTLLVDRGVDVVRIGTDLAMPSPFKERRKGKKDDKRRLSVTIVTEGDQPVILWQCWFSKRPDGTNFGGKSAYALAIVLGMSQSAVLQALDMRFDEAVAAADELSDKMTLIMTQREREETDTIKRRQTAVAAVQPLTVPAGVVPLFTGSPMTWRGEDLMATRQISATVTQHYHLGWDFDANAVFMPWRGPDGQHVYHQWWQPEWPGRAYRFPAREPGKASKGDAIFGIDTWRSLRPLVLCEGAFDAMTVGGCHLGGSTLTTAQSSILLSLSPRPALVILALDKDGAGVHGAQVIAKTLKQTMPESSVVIVFPPAKDWNQLAQDVGAEQALTRFVASVREARSDDNLLSMVKQIIR